MPARSANRVICIVGGARTGTHLLNAVLCSSPEVTPLLTESAPVAYLIHAYRQTLAHVDMYPGVHFDRSDEILRLYAQPLAAFIEHLRVRHRRPVVVLRQPALAREAVHLDDLLRAGDQDAIFLATVRDPRDAVTSMLAWEEVRTSRGRPLITPGDDRPRALAAWLLSFYPHLLEPDRARVHFIRYEDLVSDTAATVGALAETTGLSLEPRARWDAGPVRFSREVPHIGEAVTNLFGAPISAASMGAWKGRLDPQEAAAVLEVCRPLVERFYPELAPPDVSSGPDRRERSSPAPTDPPGRSP